MPRLRMQEEVLLAKALGVCPLVWKVFNQCEQRYDRGIKYFANNPSPNLKHVKKWVYVARLWHHMSDVMNGRVAPDCVMGQALDSNQKRRD